MKKNLLICIGLIYSIMLQALPAPRQYYQLTVIHFSTETQEKLIDQYLSTALLPAYHRMSVGTIGIFKAMGNDTAADKKIYVLLPATRIDDLVKLPGRLTADKKYASDASAFIDAPASAPAFTRMETILLLAFPDAPIIQQPTLKSDKSERVYELRSYESPSEKIFQNKVRMFNEGGEIKLFRRLNFNAVFYAEVIAGAKMPNLMYMTSFENMQDHDAHWKSFGDDPEWKKLSADPIYQNNVSHIDITLLHATTYSDL